MRILLANKFYYRRGGDCIYAMELERLLIQAGHNVAFFSMDCPDNQASPWAKYWPKEVSFSPKKPLQFFRALFRPFGDRETVAKFKAMLDAFKPDVLHLNNVHTQLSPVLAEIAHQRGIRVVWTLHDYKLLCPAYTFYNSGKICEKCLHGDKTACQKFRCVKQSRLASWIARKEAECWNRERLEKCVDTFICPSAFMKKKMEEGGFNPQKLIALHNFINADKFGKEEKEVKRENYYCYVGRLSEEKGIRTLLQVASGLKYPLKVLGTGPIAKEMMDKYRSCKQISFMGHCNWNVCRDVLSKAKFSVVPSEWYENNPLSIIESLSLGTPVLGADIGGIPELIEPGISGNLFKMGDEKALSLAIEKMFHSNYTLDVQKEISSYATESYLEIDLSVYEGR